MNGRLYDPLLRRFLNADKNIQDPYNTQNYNKYGYVLNNPLMYNDPSGEFFVAGFFLTWIAPVIWGAIIGTAVGAGMYLATAAITGNWSWSGFGKSVLMGAVTGGITGGIGQVFSAGNFWATIGNGALTGSIGGGIDALINGKNFLEGITKGAVIGGTVAGISYTVNYFRNPRYSELTKSEYDSYGLDSDGKSLDPSVKTLRSTFKEKEWDKMNTGAKQFYVDHVSGPYIKKGDLYFNTKTGEDVIAYTRRNFWAGNTSSISFSKFAFSSKIGLEFTMMHELAHSTINLNNALNNFLQYKTKNGFEPEMLPSYKGMKISVEHGAIWGIERDFLLHHGLKTLPSFFNQNYEFFFNNYFLKGQQYNHVYEAIKHLVK